MKKSVNITNINPQQISILQGYENGTVTTMNSVKITIKINTVKCNIIANVVSDAVQNIPVLVRRNFTEKSNVEIIKDKIKLRFFSLSSAERLSTKIF